MFQDQLKEKVRPLINLIDDMRSLGIGEELNLPTIVVVGDQSSGKSSVLEALSGVALPRGTGIVTRCPLLLQLCNDQHTSWKAKISYRDISYEFTEPLEVGSHVKEAQDELAGNEDGICEELITLKIMSSKVCDLTLIDLPGIARVAVKGQPEDIAERIKCLINNYIEKEEIIILVVVPCNIDIATTEALLLAQKVDPEGTRTLGILTKPDLIDPGAEKTVFNIVKNKTIPLNLGYVIVKCRGQKQIDDNMSIVDAIEDEQEFFRKHSHFSSLDEKITIGNLSKKLTVTLVEHIKKSLPEISEKIKNMLGDVRNELNKLKREPPQDNPEKKNHLIKVIKEFNEKITQLSYGDSFSQENLFKTIESIQDLLSKTARERIAEQFQMEMLVYTQDELFNIQNELEEYTTDYTDHDQRTNYPKLLKAYYEIVVQRLGDQVPMLIVYFILKEGAKNLCSEMLSLLCNSNMDEVLREDPNIEMNRRKLKSLLDNILLADEKLSNF
ncbi:hypothetical protein DPEC_G00119220 [Dallia pectoralis]|uniref:Uncharacterized protein n=1 Tax=Dallia pectoralis TaxID=75939 RepID=A0ACC2GPI6_DALPE|nr:hypothetical protein DPEC_G00119220 [Dallia pectoralis]